jgi:hypothetical protein
MKINLKIIKNISQLFLVAIIVLSYIIFMTDSCKKHSYIKIPEVNTTQKIIDSITIISKIKDEKHIQDSIYYSLEKEKFSKQLDSTKKLLFASRDKINYYNNQLKIADLKLDTSSFYNYCDSLANESYLMSEKLTYFIFQNDSLKKINDSISITQQQRLEERNYIISVMHNAQANFNLKYDSLASAYNKAIEKNNMQYNIGIGGAIGLTNIGTPGAVVGIVVSKNIARFSLSKK